MGAVSVGGTKERRKLEVILEECAPVHENSANDAEAFGCGLPVLAHVLLGQEAKATPVPCTQFVVC